MRRILFAVFVLLAAGSSWAYQDEYIEVTLVSEQQTLQPGSTTWLAVKLKPIDHWHVYWQNPGDAGLAPKVSLSLPEGLTAGEVEWPVPKRMVDADIATYGYDETLLMFPISVEDSVNVDQSATIEAAVRWLVCKEGCIQGSAKLQLTLPVSAMVPMKTKHAKIFSDTRQHIPQPLPGVARYQVADNQIKLELDSPLKVVDVFPITAELVGYNPAPEVAYAGEGMTIRFPISEYATDMKKPFDFVVSLSDGTALQGRAEAMDK
ncbi:protein-disulfide reductase DsbD family protein [Porticoccaceae bacterium LTM1]|nr:protein-disulfide reductase DsbD family protein [Porticoccaceae bacterium LTM1]